MVQVVKRTVVKGETYETNLCYTDEEWGILQKHYPFGGVSFHLLGGKVDNKKDSLVGRDKDDDKPNMKDYFVVKERGMAYFHEQNWDKALYYLQAAKKLKGFGWLSSKIAECEANAKKE